MTTHRAKKAARWVVYVLRCADGTLYTGVTTDLARRLKEHNGTGVGARYTRSRQPVAVFYSEKARNRSAALIREAALKKLPRAAKLALPDAIVAPSWKRNSNAKNSSTSRTSKKSSKK